MNSATSTFRALEESLWRAETRFDRDYMERVLAQDFLEYGRSGRSYDRDAIMAMPGDGIPVRLPLSEFLVSRLATDVVLVTYVTDRVEGENVEQVNRASIWVHDGGRWRLRFHQGTARSSG